MAVFNYEIAVNWDNSGAAVNFEDYFGHPLRGTRVPLGSVIRQTLDRRRQTNGAQRVTLTTENCYFENLESYVDAIHGGWDGDEDVAVTVRWRQLDNTFAYFNARAFLPREGTHYEHETVDHVRNLRLEFEIISEAS